MKPKNALLFDLDGTLLDTAPDLIDVFNTLLIRHGQPTVELEDIRHLLTHGSRYFIQTYFSKSLSAIERDALREEFLQLYSHHGHLQTKLFPGMLELLEAITELRIPWGVVTNKLTRHTHENLACLTLPSQPMVIVCGDTLPVIKPDPEPLLHACKLMDLVLDDTLFIGDSDVDAQTGQNAGIDTLIVEHGYNTGKGQFENLSIAGWITKPDEVLRWFW